MNGISNRSPGCTGRRCFPKSVRGEVAEQKVKLPELFEEDRAVGLAGAWLPEALLRKHPHGGEKWPWQYFFRRQKPQRTRRTD